MTTHAPQKLGRYEILEEIGKGAMGVVYLARDPLIGRQVALKTFRVGFSAKDQELVQFRSRFVREAQSAGILSHPNIVTIHDVVDEGSEGVCFIAMEFVKGTNLKQLMQKSEPFGYDRLIDIISQIAEGLDYAHSRGVVHRDIKPANILIAQDGKVKITDFGIARLDTSNLTMEGQLLGTPNYMAPEQIQGKEVDHRADIFSLGVVFYEMLTRKKPFQGENLTAVTHKIVYEPFTPAEDLIKDLPAGLSAIMSRCLEKDPNRRYPRAAEIAAELRRAGSRRSDPVIEEDPDDDTSATQEVAEETADRTAPRPADPDERPYSRKTNSRPIELAAVAAAAAPAPAALVPAARSGAELPGVSADIWSPLPSLPPLAALPPLSTDDTNDAYAAPPAPVPESSPSLSPSPIAVPVSSLSGSTKVSAALQRIRTQRLVQYSLLALAAVTVLVLAVLWASGRSDAAPVAPAAPTAEELKSQAVTAALADARERLDRGDLQGALGALARVQQNDPGNAAALSLREEVERISRELASAAEREQRVSDGLILAREEYSKRHYEAAIAAANGVLALVPEHPEAVKLAADSETAMGRLKEKEKAQKTARELASPTPATPPASVLPSTKPAPAATAPAAAVDVALTVDFFSELSEGVLTVYAGERQILRESFKFVKKTGFLRSEKISGNLAAQRTLPAGSGALRVYVTLPGKTTKSIIVEGAPTGAAARLSVRVDGEGRVTAQLE
ncbi:MAG: protein kinase [Thermoanaerobaculia bacterium]